MDVLEHPTDDHSHAELHFAVRDAFAGVLTRPTTDALRDLELVLARFIATDDAVARDTGDDGSRSASLARLRIGLNQIAWSSAGTAEQRRLVEELRLAFLEHCSRLVVGARASSTGCAG